MGNVVGASEPAPLVPPRARLWRYVTEHPPVVLAVLLVAALPNLCLRDAPPLINPREDLDSYMKLQGIAQDRGLLSALSYFWGDDPQHVHTFRPLPAVMLWVEYHLWGYHKPPYVLVNWLWFVATGYALVLLGRALGMPPWGALGMGVVLLAHVTRGTHGTIIHAATRHDLVCTFFAVLAVVAIMRHLQQPRSGRLVWFGVCSLLAYLSKEMALALLPLSVALAAWHGIRTEARRPALALASVALLVALVWFGWYRLAEQAMGPGGVPTHSVGSWLEMLSERWPGPLVVALLEFSQPAGELVNQFRSGLGWPILIYHMFWTALMWLFLQIMCVVVLWRVQRQWLAVLALWKLCMWLPVLPFQGTFPWYEYMPHTLDPILAVGTACVLWQHFWIKRRGRRAANASPPPPPSAPPTDLPLAQSST